MIIFLVFILGFAIGMMIHACILSYRIEKSFEIETKHKEDPADWSYNNLYSEMSIKTAMFGFEANVRPLKRIS